MKYQPTTTPIPQDRRADINAKILQLIDSGVIPSVLSKEDIFNGYTGIGGLHGLNRDDYDSYWEFATDKKEFEQGQFFTHAGIVDIITKDLGVTDNDLLCDLSCGACAFFNPFNEHQCYGCDIDHKAIRVAKFLYPEAHIDCCDIIHYEPDVKFDFVIGNPPFNLKWQVGKSDVYLSQHYFCLKAAMLLKPGGILICIVPDSYLKDEFFTKGMIGEIEEQFSFLFQYNLAATAFKNMGVASFTTKVICFQRLAESIPAQPYSSTYIKPEEAAAILHQVSKVRHDLRMQLHREFILSFDRTFAEKVKKYLYEIKAHRILRPYLAKAMGKLNQFQSQKRPDGVKYEDWEKMKLTENKVLAFMKAIIDIQSRTNRDEYKLVQDKYGYKFKAYSRKAAIRMGKVEEVKNWRYISMLQHGPLELTDMTAGMKKLARKKKAEFDRQTRLWKEMSRDPKIDTYLEKFAFYNPKGKLCKFNDFQKEDMGLVLQKDYAILNWQQGTGKTAASAAFMRYRPLVNSFVIGPALAINLTWERFMTMHKKNYVNVKTLADVNSIKPGMMVIISLDYVKKYRKQLKGYLKGIGYKANIVFDESDEITSPFSQRTRASLDVFRRCRRKLLATGTTTRNNITELYSQLEFLYNNSVNMICHCQTVYRDGIVKTLENGETIESKEIVPVPNERYFERPFPPRAGSVLFKQCFNPEKTTVLGIKKHNQDVYNEPELRRLLEYTIITRKFREIAGDKYTVSNVEVRQNASEEALYTMIINDLSTILPGYFSSTGNARKDSALRVMRQLQLLIDATSVPHMFKEYKGSDLPNKAYEIFDQVERHKEKIAVGCTSIRATEWYAKELQDRFPGRPVFLVKGEVTHKNRGKITDKFEATTNGILVCTQQSLKSSVNIPSCSRVLIESKQWNIPKIEQFFFRFIRYDSPNNTEVVFISYTNTIEMNLMALLMVKERLNDYIKTLEYKEESDIYKEYDIDLDILNSIITKETDNKGKVHINWGSAQLV